MRSSPFRCRTGGAMGTTQAAGKSCKSGGQVRVSLAYMVIGHAFARWVCGTDPRFVGGPEKTDQRRRS